MKARPSKIPAKVTKVYCDECKYEFSMNAVDIKEAAIKISGQELTLVYFACPKCEKIHRIILKDKRYEELKEDLEKIKKRIQKNYGSGRRELADVLNSMVMKKHERLKNYIDGLNMKFPGTFTFVASQNNCEEKEIKYLP